MVLVDWQIEKCIDNGLITLTPCDKDKIQPNSIDIRLGRTFVRFNKSKTIVDVKKPETFMYGLSTITANDIIIEPGEFILAETLECVKLASNMYAELHGKSSIARLGLSIHQTGGLIDSGFIGTITLEIKNESNRRVRLYAGMDIGQLTFDKTEKCRIPYGEKKGSKYQNQSGATVSKYRI